MGRYGRAPRGREKDLTDREKGLDLGHRKMEGSGGRREPEEMGRGWQEQEWDETGQAEGWAGDEMRPWETLRACGAILCSLPQLLLQHITQSSSTCDLPTP